jgi:hypothetical protein
LLAYGYTEECGLYFQCLHHVTKKKTIDQRVVTTTQCCMALWSQTQLSRCVWCCGCCCCAARGVAGAVVGLHYVMVAVAMPRAVSRSLSSGCIISWSRAVSQSPLSRHVVLLSPSGHGVVSIPNRVRVSHASPVGTAEDLSSQMTKSRYHVMSQVIRITCEIT